jgi:rod shape-determining protein MreD
MSTEPQYLLLPANRAFIAFTLVTAFVVDLLPWGRTAWAPDLLALVLVFWSVHQPRTVGIGIAFLFGLLMDVHEAGLLGEKALTFSLLSYGGITLHRRVPWFGTAGKMLHVFALLLAAHIIASLVRIALGSGLPGWGLLLSCVSTAVLWPLAEMMLLAPQRRAIERDETRPL